MAEGDLKTALANLDRFAPLFQGIIDLSAAAKELTGFEQAIGEHRVTLTGLKDEVVAAAAERDAAKAEAGKWRKDASEEVEEMRTRANADAGRILDKAREDAAAIEQTAAAKVREADAAVAVAGERLELVQGETAAAQAQLDELNGKIVEAQAKIAEMLGR